MNKAAVSAHELGVTQIACECWHLQTIDSQDCMIRTEVRLQSDTIVIPLEFKTITSYRNVVKYPNVHPWSPLSRLTTMVEVHEEFLHVMVPKTGGTTWIRPAAVVTYKRR